MAYLLLITVAMCAAYFLFYFLFPYFFGRPAAKLNKKSVLSLVYIAALSIFSYFLSAQIPNAELSNRVLHALGGGFLAFLVSFLVVKDSKLAINRFQFFVFGSLLAVALGVANEIAEFFLQNYLHYVAAATINDTWQDLISNVVGVLLAAPIFVPLIQKTK